MRTGHFFYSLLGDADLQHAHVLSVALVSTTSGHHAWYDSPDLGKG